MVSGSIVTFLSLLLIGFTIGAFLIEVGFRISYRWRFLSPYRVAPRLVKADNYVVPHPFLSFAYARGTIINTRQRLAYPLHPNRYWSFHTPLRLNNLGHFGADVSEERKRGSVRIACLGNSVTANNIADEERDYSYPSLLHTKLASRWASDNLTPEVLNCGIGGWVSADVLIDFQLNVIRTKPDYIVLYHGITDLHLYLMEGFLPDYFHGRMNLGEVIAQIERPLKWPYIPFLKSYEYWKRSKMGTGSVRTEVLDRIKKQRPDLSRRFADLTVEKDILRHLVVLCQYHRIRCVLSSYAFFAYDANENTKKMEEGVSRENELLKELAVELDTPFVDIASIMPREESYFLDWVHLTPLGMEFLAQQFAEAIDRDLRDGPTERFHV